MSRSNQLYVVTRVRVRKTKLLDEMDYEKLLKMEVPQIVRFLQDTQYEDEMDQLGARYEGATLLEYGLSLNLANDFASLLEMATGDLREDLAAYLKRYDVRNVKTLLRGKSYGADGDEVRENLVPAGELTEERLYGLGAMSIGDMLEELEGTEYGPVVEALSEFYVEEEIDAGSLSRAENEMEKIYYEGLLERLGPKTTAFSLLVRSEIDFVNVLTLLRLSADPLSSQIPEEELRELLIGGGREVGEELLEEMLEVPDLSTLLSTIRSDGPWEIPDDLDTVGGVESFLKSEMVRDAERRARKKPLSIAPIVVYVLYKQREVDRVRAIARGKESGMSVDEVEEVAAL